MTVLLLQWHDRRGLVLSSTSKGPECASMAWQGRQAYMDKRRPDFSKFPRLP